MPPDKLPDVSRLAALGTWRYTQGIYRVTSGLIPHIVDTPLDKALPCDVLMRLPEWCLYIETPGQTIFGHLQHGLFAHLEHDMETARTELRLLLDTEAGLLGVPLHLGEWPLTTAVSRFIAVSMRTGHGDASSSDLAQKIASSLTGSINLLLFVLSQAQDIQGPTGQPGNPPPTRTKRGPRIFPAENTKVWEVGVRMGAALEHSLSSSVTGERIGGVGTSPRPHIRRAHWHGYWMGPAKADEGTAATRRLELRWLPPIAVNVETPDSLVPVVRTATAKHATG